MEWQTIAIFCAAGGLALNAAAWLVKTPKQEADATHIRIDSNESRIRELELKFTESHASTSERAKAFEGALMTNTSAIKELTTEFRSFVHAFHTNGNTKHHSA